MTTTAIEKAESLVHALAAELTVPQCGECLPCYLDRMLRDARCDGTLRFARRYRDEAAPRATGLERRMCDGGGFCDCEILWNVYTPWAEEVEPCQGVRRGSTQPCTLWHRRRRGDRWEDF